MSRTKGRSLRLALGLACGLGLVGGPAAAGSDSSSPGTRGSYYVLRNPASGVPGAGYLNFYRSLSLIVSVLPEDDLIGYFRSGELIPQAEPGAAMTTRDRPVPITLKAHHYVPPGKTQTVDYSIVEQPHFGTLSGSGSSYVYTPNKGFTGFDRLVFKADDHTDGSTTARVNIKVTGSYSLFETGQVRPLAMSSDGTRLYAVNTPDNRLGIFDLTQSTPTLIGEVPVGMEPVAVALRNDGEAWVVNGLSDSVSIVDVSAPVPYVKRTLLVGDEPMDVVFAGPSRQRAFITTAHRGQNSPVDPGLRTPGIGRADVWVYDAAAVDTAGATPAPLTILQLFGMPPRGLAVSPDGGTVYAAIYKSGNQSTVVGQNTLAKGPNSTKFGKPGPQTDASGKEAPNTGIIVQYNGQHWVDSYGRSWDKFVRFNLPDKDVFAIDANAATPVVKGDFAHVGTSLFNIAVNPKSGALYVSNLEARNLNRFEGNGERADQMTVNGRFIYNRITVIKNGQVLPRNLDKHLSDASPVGSPADAAASLAMPLQMQIDSTGQTLYVAAFGSSEIGVFNVGQLETDTFTPSASSHIRLTGGGPSGLVLDEKRGRLYAMTRFDNGISVVNLGSRSEVAHLTMYNPEPDVITKGRPFLYDARFASSKGDSACGSCHLFGDNDGLAWDLGNPDATWAPNPRTYSDPFTRIFATRANHPMKGPMVTQTLHGLEFQGPQHWRGDRTGSPRYNGESLEKAAFKEFNVAFTGLLGQTQQPTTEQLDAFANFALQMRFAPNAIKSLDDQLTPAQADGEDVFFNTLTTGVEGLTANSQATFVTCNECHETDPDAQRFGTSTNMSFEGFDASQNNKIPQLRDVYLKSGMFGMSNRLGTTDFMGDQVQGFGYFNEGAVDTVEHFLSSKIFHVPTKRLPNLLEYLDTFETGLAPMVGQQFTLNAKTSGGQSRIDTMIGRALAHTKAGGPKTQRCELVAHGLINGKSRGYVLLDSGQFQSDNPSDALLSDASLRALATGSGNSLTYTCVPPGAGVREGIDRDEDGTRDAVDAQTSGVLQVSVAPVDPNAAPEVDEMQSAAEGNYDMELFELSNGTWPNFRVF